VAVNQVDGLTTALQAQVTGSNRSAGIGAPAGQGSIPSSPAPGSGGDSGAGRAGADTAAPQLPVRPEAVVRRSYSVPVSSAEDLDAAARRVDALRLREAPFGPTSQAADRDIPLGQIVDILV